MSADEQLPTAVDAPATDSIVEQERSEKILKAKELYSHGSRNFLVKSYAEAADELSQVCALYEELYGELSDEIGMPYLLYAKSLIALALDENKVIDVPDEEEDNDDDDDDDDGDGDGNGENDDVVEAEAKPKAETEAEAKAESVEKESNGEATAAASSSSTNGAAAKLATIKESADKTETDKKSDEADSTETSNGKSVVAANDLDSTSEKASEEAQVSSTDDTAVAEKAPSASSSVSAPVVDGEKPSTSNGADAENMDEEEEENEAASSLQLAWEILELAAKIFSRQGLSGLSNLAEVQTELANIEFENNILDSARDDYERALKIYEELPTNYRRAMAEIHYKIGLTYLMQQLNKEGAESLKQACKLIESEIAEIRKNPELSDKEKNNIQDMEETKQEIWAKIAEIEDTQAQNIAEVRAALDSYIKPIPSASANGASTSSSAASSAAGPSSSSASSSTSAISSSSKPTDITHLIKRKKPEEPGSEAEAASPAKRPAL